MAENKKLSILIVTYNDAKHLIPCTTSIYEKFSKIDFEIIIINNDDKQDVLGLPLDFSRIKLVDNRKNVGFGSGMNLGAKIATGEFLLILNPDTEIRSDNVLELLEEFSKNEQIGIVGGGIIDRNGNRQEWSAGKELSLYDLFRNNLGISRSKSIWNSSEKVECDWVAGTVLFIKRNIFEQLGGFDERFFMYFEDMDLCKRVRATGKKIYYFPEFFVFHGSGESYEDKRLQKSNYYDSMEKYFKKHCGLLSWLFVKCARKFLVKK